MFNNQLYANYNADIKTADQWREFIAGGRSKTDRKAANNTTVRLIDGGVAIRLHSTDIVTINDDGSMVLNSGGWLSVTTKERLNRYTPARISQRAGIWYMADGSLFYDGMIIEADGRPRDPREPSDHESKLKAIKRDAKAYARGYVEALKAGSIDYPSGGDCWYCSMRTEGGEPLGDASNNTEHIRDHIAERYYVPSLLVNAGRAAGYQDHQIGLMGIGGHRVFIDPERVIYRYIVKKLQSDIK